MHILFVCTGNTCRSPMAEGLFKNEINKSERQVTFTCSSAGISAFSGDHASTLSVNVLKAKWNIDMNGHRARSITQYDIIQADLILTMTVAHKNIIVEAIPEARTKTFTLKEYVGKSSWDLQDPYGGDYGVYLQCAEEIQELVVLLIEKLTESPI